MERCPHLRVPCEHCSEGRGGPSFETGTQGVPRHPQLSNQSDQLRCALALAGTTQLGECARPNWPDVVALAKQLQAGGMSLRKISATLAAQGHLTGGGNRRC